MALAPGWLVLMKVRPFCARIAGSIGGGHGVIIANIFIASERQAVAGDQCIIAHITAAGEGHDAGGGLVGGPGNLEAVPI